MRRASLINLLLLLLVGGLALSVWLTPDRQDGPATRPLTRLDPAAVQQITIHNGKAPRFILQRQAAGWQMTEPYRVAANGARIEKLLGLLTTPAIESFPLPADRLAEFGLEEPLAELTFDQTRIIFGGTHPYNHRRYLRIDDQLYLIKDIFPHHATARAEEFISPNLFPPGAQISEVNLPDWRLYRQQQRWVLDPDPTGTDPSQLVQKVTDWQQVQAGGVSRAPDTVPEQQLSIRLQNQPHPIRLGLIRQGSGILLINPVLGLAYRLDNDNLLKPPGEGP
ncbi:DUF4340 domain-containing protein [Sedimenticola thiotaurini]|uniref:DUF4340 domain-containing protein n=1 Tax=Sedimenticola thiotaurini TaxID=1543721 RepID=UPI00069CA26A|nr:DUF4340 domain-containing protein [Sedimenticola thiotaurini]